ncbi:hypothetical protein GPECTOR_1g447 [Gonium pectorale]|uniref:Uncharacterized protein n=1 Tax=Gonium pectorale TaxID=33097 RepID=A0A150H2V6_GONPE|nr:hypothetical protein GPECTOR_1g447 [Gonium pectorale]|eukprot:KXZ56499.1 hypothetical protein GPECTOR_1g447 [Gonium pectorale]
MRSALNSCGFGERLLEEPIRQSEFDALAKSVDDRGLWFKPIDDGRGADPLGLVLRSSETSLLHEVPRAYANTALHHALDALGLSNPEQFRVTGSARRTFANGERREPDGSFEYKPAAGPFEPPGPPTLVLEVAHEQSRAELLAALCSWVGPAGGGAKLAIGIYVHAGSPGQEQGAEADHRLEVHVYAEHATSGAPTALGPPITLTRHSQPGLLWLPLTLLMPGSSRAERAVLSARIAAAGLLGGLWRCVQLPVWPVQSARWAMARWCGPWGALPLDLCQLVRTLG